METYGWRKHGRCEAVRPGESKIKHEKKKKRNKPHKESVRVPSVAPTEGRRGSPSQAAPRAPESPRPKLSSFQSALLFFFSLLKPKNSQVLRHGLSRRLTDSTSHGGPVCKGCSWRLRTLSQTRTPKFQLQNCVENASSNFDCVAGVLKTTRGTILQTFADLNYLLAPASQTSVLKDFLCFSSQSLLSFWDTVQIHRFCMPV